ncbi:nucleotide exchange factor GrpE [Clostridium psychrophilum]|uniref:nucleotide exchange factor GrpE n=1 Tax=Clostridium psychrophilum TaxID=132926 RepID=UPI001C0DD9A5|nr:nucleotide exchange factor GrpE [Clostridium psychrophilum]MBU3182460.1 nucleotide exchange factor GrpE [Clostridium psychrophilum]
MLDIKEELKNYKAIELDTNLKEKEGSNDELNYLLNMFTKTFERIGKEQYKSASGIEDILDLLEENNESNSETYGIVKELREKAQIKNNEIKSMINTIISISDIFDYVNGYALKSNNENLKDQFKLVSQQIGEKLAQNSITVIGIEDGEFDLSVHQPIAVEWQPDKPENVILQVVKKGYIYKGNVLRKAEIVINKKSKDEGNDFKE